MPNGKKMYLPLYCHDDTGKYLNGFNSLSEAQDYIDKYMVTNRGEYRTSNKECHYIIRESLDKLSYKHLLYVLDNVLY